jgi:hypothetical protein
MIGFIDLALNIISNQKAFPRARTTNNEIMTRK